VADLESKLKSFIQENSNSFYNPPIGTTSYKRQYFGELLAGHHIIVGNFFCSDLGYNWKQVLILSQVVDGGDCFFILHFDVEEGKFVDGVEVFLEP
jgi:hypothetical protein